MWLPITILVIFTLFVASKTIKKLFGVVDKAVTAVDAYCDLAVAHSQHTRDAYIANLEDIE